MEDYVLDFIPDCIRRVQRDSGETDVTVIGYCFGGVLSLLYGSIFADGPMKNLICFTTPVDFREMKLFQNFSDRRYFDVDRLVDSVGNVPPEMILSSFEMLRPASRAASQVQLWENIWNDEYVKSYRMFDRWATDTLPLAGEYFRTITKDLMWDNKLYNDTMSVGGRKADISKIKVPILHAVAEHDHIVPYDAAKPLIQKIGSTDKEEVMLKGGHVSLVAGANAIKRLWPKLDSWLMREIDMSSANTYLSAPRCHRGRRHRVPDDGAGRRGGGARIRAKASRCTICCSCRATSASRRCWPPGSRRSSAARSSACSR